MSKRMPSGWASNPPPPSRGARNARRASGQRARNPLGRWWLRLPSIAAVRAWLLGLVVAAAARLARRLGGGRLAVLGWLAAVRAVCVLLCVPCAPSRLVSPVCRRAVPRPSPPRPRAAALRAAAIARQRGRCFYGCVPSRRPPCAPSRSVLGQAEQQQEGAHLTPPPLALPATPPPSRCPLCCSG